MEFSSGIGILNRNSSNFQIAYETELLNKKFSSWTRVALKIEINSNCQYRLSFLFNYEKDNFNEANEYDYDDYGLVLFFWLKIYKMQS